jgi:hypothetical protein
MESFRSAFALVHAANQRDLALVPVRYQRNLDFGPGRQGRKIEGSRIATLRVVANTTNPCATNATNPCATNAQESVADHATIAANVAHPASVHSIRPSHPARNGRTVSFEKIRRWPDETVGGFELHGTATILKMPSVKLTT